MPALRELEARFIRYKKDIAGPGHGRALPDGTMQWGGFEIDVEQEVESLQDAQGITFLCPLCYKNNKGSIGTHSVSISFDDRNVLPDQGSQDGNGATRWKIEGGTGLDDLRLSPSILMVTGCGWHGFIGHSGVQPGHAE